MSDMSPFLWRSRAHDAASIASASSLIVFLVKPPDSDKLAQPGQRAVLMIGNKSMWF
jgi:hypothetical protein